jgi:hypothetical protein
MSVYDSKKWGNQSLRAKSPFHCSCIVFLNIATLNAASNLHPNVPVLSCSALNVMKMQIKKRRVKCIPHPCLLRRSADLVLVGVEVTAETAGTGDDAITTNGSLSKRSANGTAVVTDAK